MHWECVPTSRRQTKQSRIHMDLTSWFLSGRLTATVRVSQMISDERGLGKRAEIRQVGRSEFVQTSVYKGTQFESDTIWHLEPVQLSSHNSGNRRRMWELQNKSGGGTEDGL